MLFSRPSCRSVKVRLQTQPSALPGQALRYSGPLHCAWRILKEEGVRGFFKVRAGVIVAALLPARSLGRGSVAPRKVYARQPGRARLLSPSL